MDKLAAQGNPKAFAFPLSDMKGLSFSFSGIKTAVLYFLRENLKKDPDFIGNNLEDICASVQDTLIRMLMQKLVKATKERGIKEVAIAGGVSANSGLRQTIKAAAKNYHWNVYLPKLEYCTDNAAMIAMAAHFKFQAGKFADLNVSPLAKLKIGNHG